MYLTRLSSLTRFVDEARLFISISSLLPARSSDGDSIFCRFFVVDADVDNGPPLATMTPLLWAADVEAISVDDCELTDEILLLLVADVMVG